MHWFKIVLICMLLLSIALNLVDVGKGEYQKKNYPIANLISAVICALFVWGIIVFL